MNEVMVMAKHAPKSAAELNREKVYRWLAESVYEVRSEPPTPQVTWLLSAQTVTDGRSVLIGQPKGTKDTVLIQVALARSQSQIQELELLPRAQREDLMWSLRLLLIGMDIDYSPIEHPLVLIRLTTVAYLEGPHKDAFLQKVTHLFKAIEAVYLTIDRAVAGVDSTPETTH